MAKTNKEKEMIYKKFQANNDEKKILANKEITLDFGETTITVKRLIWDDANDFEDAILEIFSKFSNIKLDTSNINVAEIGNVIIKSILRDDLLTLANLASEGKVTLEYIREVRASKDDVIKLIGEAIMLNYSYIKNLVALGQTVL